MGPADNRAAVEAAYVAFGKGDIPSVIAMNAPDALWVIHTAATAPYQGEHKGIEGIGTLFGLLPDSIDITEFDMAPVAIDGDVVVAKGVQTYTVKKTGKTVSGSFLHLFTFGPDGKVARFEEWEPAESLDAWG